MVYVALAVMTGLAMGFVLWPLAFRTREAAQDSREAAFYRGQLEEIARDVERGQLPEAEAASARTEAARRLIAASDGEPQSATSGALGRRRAAAVAIFLVVPAVALGVYAEVGQPELPDEPLSARTVDLKAPGAIEAAVAKVEAHLMKAPDDRRGWEVLAPIYMQMSRFPDAAGAYRRIIQLGGDAPAVRADLGQALMAMADGVVTADARAEFEKAPDLPISKFYLALAAEQDGKVDEAKAAYQALASQASGDAPWMLGLRARLAALNGGATAAPPAGAPGAEAFSPEQAKMIAGMVQGLAERLARQGGSAAEWARLIRAYSVLHEPDKAKAALASARKALGVNPDIDALARELRL